MIIAVLNHKGGTGKTTTVDALAVNLANRRIPVRLVDLDPQGDLSQRWGAMLDRNNSIGDVLGGRIPYRNALQTVSRHGADVQMVPSDIKLQETAAWLGPKALNHKYLRRALSDLSFPSPAEITLVDCAPAADILTLNAICSADYVLIPTSPAPDAIEGMRRSTELVMWLKTEGETRADVLGCYVTAYNGNTVAHQDALRRIDGGPVAILGTIKQRQGRDAEADIIAQYGATIETFLSAAGYGEAIHA